MDGRVAMRDFRPEDLDAVLALRARCFDQHDDARERRRWAWQYDQNPARREGEVLSWVLEHEGSLVGHFGRIPCRVQIDGQAVSTFTGTDFCVDPRLRSHGLGLMLARRFVNEDPEGFPFATAPVAGSLPLWRLCGAQVLPGISEPMLWVAVEGVEAPAMPARREVEELTEFGAEFDELFRTVSQGRRLLTIRDAESLNWRYARYPFGRPDLGAVRDGAGALRGLVVMQADARLGRGYVPELFCDPADEDGLRAALSFALRRRRERGLGELYVLVRDPAVHRVLREAGFHRVDDHPLGFVGRPPAGGPGLEHWSLSSGDGDLLFSVDTEVQA